MIKLKNSQRRDMTGGLSSHMLGDAEFLKYSSKGSRVCFGGKLVVAETSLRAWPMFSWCCSNGSLVLAEHQAQHPVMAIRGSEGAHKHPALPSTPPGCPWQW